MAKGKYLEWITEDGLLLLESYAREGLSDEQIAKKIGINPATLYSWKSSYSEIDKAIKKGKAPVDVKVENALYKSATGYTVTVKKPIKLKKEKRDEKGRRIVCEYIEYAEEEVYIPANTTAQIYWLNNRRRNRWKNKWDESQQTEETASSGLVEALSARAADIQEEDDSSMLPLAEDGGGG